MTRKRRTSIHDLPQTNEIWHVAVRRLKQKIYLQDEDSTFRPYVLLILDEASEFLLNELVLSEFPNVEEVEQFVIHTLKRSDERLGMEPHRPASVLCERMEWVSGLREAMNPYSIEVSLGQPPEIVDEFIEELENYIQGDAPEIPGLLSVPGMTPEIAARFFDSAAELWQSEPWVWLNDRQILAVHTQEDQAPWFVQFMGHGGYEYGFILYQNWQDILKPLKEDLSIPERLPGYGWHSLSYDHFDDLPVEDQFAIQDYGWTIVNEAFCPFPGIFTHESIQRPPPEELILLEEIIRGVTIFTRDFLQPDGEGDYQPVEADIEIVSFGGPKTVHVHYPARRFTPDEIPYGAGEFNMTNLESDGDTQTFDRRSLEADMAEFVQTNGEEHPAPEILTAQEIIYQAWGVDSPNKRVMLAHKALEISSLCVDAYNILAEDDARTLAQAMNYYRLGMEAGEKSLGKASFKEDSGHFWGMLETRPYMRARLGLANCLREAGELNQAIQHYRELLRLNTSDNQGVRYILLDVLMDMGQWRNARDLLEDYQDERVATWLYSHALLTFYLSGETEEANRQLQAALESNPLVPFYLMRIERMPRDLPQVIMMGDESEAVDYAAAHLNYWYRIPGAIDWLGRHTLDHFTEDMT